MRQQGDVDNEFYRIMGTLRGDLRFAERSSIQRRLVVATLSAVVFFIAVNFVLPAGFASVVLIFLAIAAWAAYMDRVMRNWIGGQAAARDSVKAIHRTSYFRK